MCNKKISRDERQEESRVKWIKSKCRGTVEACTGFGKTKVALNCIKSVLKRYPNFRVLVVVPTELLQNQWISQLDKEGLSLNAKVEVINTTITYKHDCELLIIDEIHKCGAETFKEVFKKVKYLLILGLTATLKRLDNKHTIIEKYCPVVDTIPIEVALANGWVSQFTEYKVYLDVDLTQYNEYNREFNEHFAFFNYNFQLANKCVGKNGLTYRLALRDKLYTGDDKKVRTEVYNNITKHANGVMKMIQLRKSFIYSHPDKIRLTREIIKARPASKIITFSATTKIAESIGVGEVYTGRSSKKRSADLLERFALADSGIINTVKKADEGFDCPGLSVAIILGMDSSSTKAVQRKGRVIRYEEGKHAEIFTFVIRGTIEEEWFNKSHENSEYITIDEENLMHVLKGEPFEQCKKKPMSFIYRF